MQQIAIIGLGRSGRAAAHYFQKHKVPFFGVDRKQVLDVDFPVFSENDPIDLARVEKIVKSPGIPLNHPWIVHGRHLGIPVVGEIDLALDCMQMRNKTLVAITGSNGKTTTTLLVEHLLKQSGYKAVAAGNVGIPLISQIDEDAEIFIIELSSFQLEDIVPVPLFSAAAILNLTPNHLDRHPTFESYAAAKFRLQLCVKRNTPLIVSQPIFDHFSHHQMTGVHWEIFQSRKERVAPILPLEYRENGFRLYPHDFENCLAAFAITQSLGMTEEAFREGIKTFQKPPHRVEWVGQLKGVSFVNDSKGTSVDAVIKAVAAMPGPVILIAGGVDKGGSYKEWIPFFKGKVSKILVIGEAAIRMMQELAGDISTENTGNLESAVKRAYALAKEGDTVLLSPGCSSYDQFENYEKRGNTFKTLIYKLMERTL